MVEHIVHIDGVTGSSPVATTKEPNRKVRLNLDILARITPKIMFPEYTIDTILKLNIDKSNYKW